MRIGIIDLGTNSVRFDVHQIGPGKKVKRLHREKIMVRLGQGIFLKGKLDSHATRRTLQAFHQFRRLSDQYRTNKVIAFGTSALREVSDRDAFLETLQRETGIHVRVISGSEEAKLIALGILHGEKRVPKRPFALVDIGGGSTEMSICRGHKILHSYSFPLGTARLQQLFLKKSPPSLTDIAELRRHIRNVIYEITLSEQWPQVEQVIGSSGTIRALDKIIKKRGQKDEILKPGVHELVERMSRMTTTELLGIPGMESKRVDMILAGGILFEECMETLGAKRAESTELSLRDGILQEELSLFRGGTSDSHLTLHFAEIYQKAKLMGGDEQHLTRVNALACDLFDRLKSVHRLEPKWKTYLSAACILRDTGESVNQTKHPTHSYYIVKHSDLPAMDGWERELIAQLCLHHEGAKLDAKDLNFTKNKIRKNVFPKLLAILRIADALDPGPDVTLRIRSVSIGRKGVKIRHSGRNLTGLESASVAKKSPYFEKVFGRSVSLER